MEYNFDEVVNRRNTNSYKWDSAGEDVLPMWIADMDFETAPEITQALVERASKGLFGYVRTPDAFYNAIINWWSKKHNLTLNKNWIATVPGIVPALAASMRALTSPGDKVVIQPPVYNHFFDTIQQSQCTLVENNLLLRNGNYYIDFEDLEQKLSDAAVKVLLLSNPHNPAGRVWTKDELQQMGDLCIKHNVIVLSDEIHADLVLQDNKHVPFASLGEAYANNSITYSSPSKAFNLAGLQVGYFFTQNEKLKKSVNDILLKQEMIILNSFAVDGLIAAYEKSEHWLEAVKKYIYNNYLQLCEFGKTHFPALKVAPLQATYLVWIDCSALKVSSKVFADWLMSNAGLWISRGTMYGEAGEYFIRINIACPKPLLLQGLERLAKGYHRFVDQSV